MEAGGRGGRRKVLRGFLFISQFTESEVGLVQFLVGDLSECYEADLCCEGALVRVAKFKKSFGRVVDVNCTCKQLTKATW